MGRAERVKHLQEGQRLRFQKSNLMFSLEMGGWWCGEQEEAADGLVGCKPFPHPFPEDHSIFPLVSSAIIPGGHKDTGPGNQKPESRHATLTVFTESKIIIYRKRNIELIDF